LGVLVSEIECISTCITGQGPLVSGFNYFIIAAIILGAIILIFFHKRLSIKWNLLLKAIFLTAVFAFLISLFFAQSHDFSIFKALHTISLFLVILFFATSYLLTPFIAQLGLKRHLDKKLESLLSEEAKALGMKKPNLFVFQDLNRTAFVVSGLKKTIFLSTGLVEKLSESELRIVLKHELLHLKSGFFKTKRFLHSVKAGFFGLLPLRLEELDTIEEMRLDNKLLQEGLDVKKVRQKL